MAQSLRFSIRRGRMRCCGPQPRYGSGRRARRQCRPRDALEAAEPERLIRTIVDQEHRCTSSLSFAPRPATRASLEDLIAATATSSGRVLRRCATTLVEPLSPREVEVLRYLCSRMTYREIAAALYVSLNTLKTHVRTVYRKLDVESRADAVDAGRRLGVI